MHANALTILSTREHVRHARTAVPLSRYDGISFEEKPGSAARLPPCSTREHVREALLWLAKRAAAEERTSGVDEPLQIGLVDHVADDEDGVELLGRHVEKRQHRLVALVEVAVVDEVGVRAVLGDDVDRGAFDALDHDLGAALAEEVEPHTAVAFAERLQSVDVKAHIQIGQVGLRQPVDVALLEQPRTELVDERYVVIGDHVL